MKGLLILLLLGLVAFVLVNLFVSLAVFALRLFVIAFAITLGVQVALKLFKKQPKF